MGEKVKVLKIQVGQVFIDGKSHGVFLDAWEKKTKEGKTYFVGQFPIFVSSVERKDKTPKAKENLDFD